MFQHIVDEGAVFRGLESGGPPGLGPQAVLHEVGEVAGLVLVHPGGRHGYPVSIEGVDRWAGQPPPLPLGGQSHPLHQGGILRQFVQSPGGLGKAPRQLQGGPGGRQPEGTVQPRLLHPVGIVEHGFQPGNQEGRPVFLPLRPGGGPADIKPLPGQGAGLVDNGHLPVQLVPCPGGGLQTIGSQQTAVIVAEQSWRRGHRRDGPVVRPQQKHRPVAFVGQPGHLPGVYPVQGNGDGAHVVLGEHQSKEPGKFLQLHGGVPQNLGALLQTAAQDVPQLGVLLRQSGLVPLPQLHGPLRQPLGHPDGLQKAV